MQRIKYTIARIFSMDYKAMIKIAKRVHQICGKNTLLILIDMIICGFRYSAGYMDYLVFEFFNLNAKQRATYITRGQNDKYVKRLNDRNYWYQFEDKAEFLKAFNSYIKRDFLDMRVATVGQLGDFLEKHNRVIVKPVAGTCGKGIEFIENVGNITDTYNYLMDHNLTVVEQLVVQHPTLSKLYPKSVNTIRIVTMLTDQPHVIFVCIRLGNGKQVDNLNSGGMSCTIDINTGKINAPAADKDGKAYDVHPFTGESFLHVQIPHYQAAIEMVKQAALVIPQVGYVGWDVAITEDGPLLIEANQYPGHDIYQFQIQLGKDKIGLMPRFDAVFNKLNKG